MYILRSYKFKKLRYKIFKALVKVLGVQAELDWCVLKESEFARNRGQWQGLDAVLHLINTYDTNMVNKKQLYKDVMEMRPK